MCGLALSRLSPGAETCVVVGALEQADQLDLGAYRSVLWFTQRPPARRAAHVQLASLEPARAAASLEALIRRDALHLPSVFVTDEASGEAAPKFLPVVETIVAQFESHQRVRATRQQDGFRWQRHLLTNLPHYAQRRVPAAWAGALAGLPAIVCGAGPSLDASIAHLKKFADRAVIFAADSALRALARAGVTPDFALSVDAGKTPAKTLAPDAPPPPRVILSSVSPPEWHDAIAAENIFFLSSRQITEDWLATLGLARTAIGVEENCGITGLALARHLGCDPVYLFGMDHAVDSKNPARWHERHGDAKVFDQQIGFSAGASYPKVPGNYQEEIATPLFREWRALDALCAGLPENFVFNVTDRGARLRNTTLVAPENFSLPAAGTKKSPLLAALPPPAALDATAWMRVCGKIHAVAARAGTMRELAPLFRDPEISRLFGNYALKAMPHLLRSDAADPAVLEQLRDECTQLIALARGLT